jgi:hypothetical protein
VDALEGIRADEVAAVSTELRRSVTRPAQIVPEVAKLVAAKRARSSLSTGKPISQEWAINQEASRRRAAVSAKDKRALSDIWEWERQARIDAGLHVPEYPKPLNSVELEQMPEHIRQFGLAHGFLKRDGTSVVEA